MPDLKKKLILRLPAVILLAGSVLFWANYDRYEPAGPVMVDSPTLAAASKSQGIVSESEHGFVLHVPAGGKTAKVRFPLADAAGYRHIRVSAGIQVDGVLVGKYHWRCGRVTVAQYDAKGKWIPGHHGVVAEHGTKKWTWREDVFEILPATERVDMVIEHSGLAGTVEFRGLRAEPVQLKTSFTFWRVTFAALWIVAGIIYFRRCRLHCRRLKVLILLNALAIITGALMPGEWLEQGAEQTKEYLSGIRAPVPRAAPKAPAVAKPAKPASQKNKASESSRMDSFIQALGSVHRFGHFALFASLCFLVYLSAALEQQHRIYFLKVGFDIFIFAGITETLQNLTVDRAAGWRDLLVDVYGMALAVVLFAAVLPLIRAARLRAAA